jgi:hypothetical protein
VNTPFCNQFGLWAKLLFLEGSLMFNLTVSASNLYLLGASGGPQLPFGLA